MARQRMIWPEIWDSEQVADLTDFEFRIYIGLISHADDDGRLPANPVVLASKIFTMAAKENTPAKIRSAIERMEMLKLVAVYGGGDRAYVAHPKWTVWQRIEKPRKSKYPAPPDSRGYAKSRSLVTAYGYKLKPLKK